METTEHEMVWVPVVTAHLKPFRLVVRDENDTWAPDIGAINARTYDYAKLNRVSDFLDVGLSPLSMAVCFDGTLLLPAMERFKGRTAAAEKFNNVATALLLGGLYCEAVAPNEVGFGQLSEIAYSRMQGGGSGQAAMFHKGARTKLIGPLESIELFEPEKVTIQFLQDAFKRGNKILDDLGSIPHEPILYGSSFFVQAQWAEALLHLWTICECAIEELWKKSVIHNQENMSGRRKQFLGDHRTWPISTKIEVLLQKQSIPWTLYEVLDGARKLRNDFIHRGTVPDQKGVEACLNACFSLLSLVASNFQCLDAMENVAALILEKCQAELYPKAKELHGVTHWMELPPLPGDKRWGDRPFEVIDDLRLVPLKPR